MNPLLSKFNDSIGVALVLAGVGIPVALLGFGDDLYRLIAGAMKVPDQSAMVLLTLAGMLSVPVGALIGLIGLMLILVRLSSGD